MVKIRFYLSWVVLLLCNLIASAHDFEVGGIYYTITSSADLTVKVTYRGNSYNQYSNEYSGAVTIPSTATYNSKTYSVTSIGDYAFYYCSSLTTITIPEGVTSIGYRAFDGCSSLTAITIPESVTSIGDYAFYYCSSLTAVHISSLEAWCNIDFSSSDANPLYYAKNLYINGELVTELAIPNSVTAIKDYAFYYCSSLTAITIPEGVTSIGSSAFFNCSRLTSITIPEGVTSIGSSAFCFCSSLTAITIPDGVTSIGERAFSSCSSLESITLPEGVTSIESSAFSGCSSLTAITIPESVTSIGSYAFDKCSSLESITLPEGVTSIGSYAFRYCSSLTAITIPEGVTSIGSDAFYGCSSLESITIPESVTSIGSYAFQYCGLTAITIPESVTSIESYAFRSCSSLTTITIPESVTSIGSYAFDNCSSLYKVINYSNLSLSKGSSNYGYVAYYAKVVYQGSELTTVGDYQFYTSNGIHSLVNYIGNDTEIVLPDSYNGENYKIGDYAFRGCSRLTAITLPEGVTSIGNCAFDNCIALKKVIIEDGNTTLSLGYNYYYNNSSTGQGLFYDCPLEEVYLGRNLSYSSDKSYGYSPFYNQDELTNVTIGDEVTAISQYAFYGCYNIHSLTISSGVLSIGSNAFSTPEKVIWLTNTPPTGYTNAKGSINYVANNQHSSLSNLKVYPYLSSMFEVGGVKYVPVSPSERTCDAIDCAYNSTAAAINVSETASFKGIAMTVKEVMPYTFYGNKHIKEVNISHKGNIESQAFYDCDGIKSLDISNVGYVGDKSFYGCGALETAIVANTGAVNSSAFYDCVSLKSATLGDKVTSLGNDAFRGCTSLQEIVIPNSVKSAGTYCFYGCTVMKSAVIGDGLTNVKEYTFANCGLEKIIIGDNITSIGNYAFKECRDMKSAVLGNGLSKVNGTMFNGCIGLENVEIGNKVTELEANAFSGCSSLPTITIPQAVTKIGDNVFVGCSKLADVIIADRREPLALGSNGSSPLFVNCPLDSVYIGGKITYNTTSSKGYSPFYRNTSLRTVVITDREEQIYANEFYGCTNLQNVAIGNGVKSIGNYAFSGCSSLEGFSFGSNMESIGAEAFSDCTNLTSLTSYAAAPPTCGSQALDDINKWNCTLYIPTGSLAAYMAADQWKEFFFIEDNVTDGIEDIIMNDKQTEIIYDLQGRRVLNTDNLKGIYIINGKKTIK